MPLLNIDSLTFTYKGTSSPAIENITFSVGHGEIVLLCGETGCGKSTLLSCIADKGGYHKGADGEIKYFGKKIGYVGQFSHVFATDRVISELAFASENENNPASETARRVCELAAVLGLERLLDRDLFSLSGGERQRLSIARAVLKNPSILVFDEATASVDSETEHLIQEAIEHLISGRTTIMIAHRLSTLSKANKIVVVDNGRIIECGTPEELMAMKGKYYKLVQIQTMADKVNRQKEEENFE